MPTTPNKINTAASGGMRAATGFNCSKGQVAFDAMAAILACLLSFAVAIGVAASINQSLAQASSANSLQYRVLMAADYALKIEGAQTSPYSTLHHILSPDFAAKLPYYGQIGGFDNISVSFADENPILAPVGAGKKIFCVTRLVVLENSPRQLEVCGW